MNSPNTTCNPTISIIIATYNRSNVLRYAISSVIWQTFQNWELIIVGDACTDDTEEVVLSFQDPRIRFINLEQNVGEQSGPNNFGMGLARGEYFAFINHDDLWFPDHLEKSLAYLLQYDLDLVMAVCAGIISPAEIVISDLSELITIASFSPASTWLFKNDVFAKIGPWRFFREIWLIPSHDWLKRCWGAGIKVQFSKSLTVVCIFSGSRKNAYKNRDFVENEQHFERMKKDYSAYREDLLMTILMNMHKKNTSFKNVIKKILIKFNLIPAEIKYRLKFLKKGGFIDLLRRRRGLPPLNK